MWRISLINERTRRPYPLPLTDTNPVQVNYTVVAAPTQFAEMFNFKGLLAEKSAHITQLALDSFVDRWQHCKPYKDDLFAPTAGNIRELIVKLAMFARLNPEGIWLVEA